MRFGNSSNYFGLRSNIARWARLKASTGKAFGAFVKSIASWLTTLVAGSRIFNRSQQCSYRLCRSHQKRRNRCLALVSEQR